MKIIHFCVGAFVDGSLNQENELIREHARNGHDVLVIASTETHDKAGKNTFCSPADYHLSEGARIIRLPYRWWLPHPIAKKIRTFPGVNNILTKFQPDIIVFHGACAWELRTVVHYIRRHPKAKLFIDCHADGFNSARNILSREILHKRFYRPILKDALKECGKILCVSYSVMEFLQDVYSLPKESLEFFPLGGRITDSEKYSILRKNMRHNLNISDDQILFIQTGKLNSHKKLSQTLRAFSKTSNPSFRLVIAGVLMEDARDECERLIQLDPRVSFIGWVNSGDMIALLCAADVYLQPGSQSNTMQMALCCGCAVVLDKVPSHEFYVKDCGWLVQNGDELERTLNTLNSETITTAKMVAMKFASEHLDYRMLAERLVR